MTETNACKLMTTKEAISRFVSDGDHLVIGNYTVGTCYNQILEIARKKVPWDLKLADPLEPFPHPSDEEITCIRNFAPQHCVPREMMYELAAKKMMETLMAKAKKE